MKGSTLPPEGSTSQAAGVALVAAPETPDEHPDPAPSQPEAALDRPGAGPASASSPDANHETTAQAPSTPSTTDSLRAILSVGEAGEILSSAEACHALFGWECPALVGQNIRVLLKGGLDNEVGRLLHRHRAGKEIPEIPPFNVTTLRKDGAQLPTCVTTLAWKSNPGGSDSEAARLSWAVEFRALAEPSPAPHPLPTEPPALRSEPLEPTNPAGTTAEPRAGDEDVVRIRRERDLLAGQVAAQQEATAAFRQRQEDLERQLNKALADLQAFQLDAKSQASELQTQLTAAQEAVRAGEAAFKEEVARKERLEERLQSLTNSLRLEQAERGKRFEQEQITLRQERDQLDARLEAERRAAAESVRKAQELEALLGRNNAEFERAKAELEQQSADREKVESSFREQLDTAFVVKKELEGAWAGALERNKRFEEELALLRKEHDELQARLKAEQQAAVESGQRARVVEGSLGRNAAEFDRIRAELDKQTAERDQAEIELREQLSAAKARKEKLEAAWAEAVERNQRFEAELTRLRQERDALKTETKLARQESADATRRAEELQQLLDQHSSEIDPIRADAEKQQSEWQRTEAKLREQLETAKAQKKEVETAWAGVVDRNVHLEEEITALRRERDQGNDRFTSERERLEGEWNEQLQTARALAKKLEAAWTASVERNKRLEADVATLRRSRDEQTLRPAADPALRPVVPKRPEEPADSLPRSQPAARPDILKPPAPNPSPEAVSDPSRKPPEPTRTVAKKVEGNGTPAPPLKPSARTPGSPPPVRPERYKLT